MVNPESAAEVAEAEKVAEENRKYFDKELVKHREWGAFFGRFENLEVVAKIGEGGRLRSSSFLPEFQASLLKE